MPGSNLPATLRIYRDGVPIVEVARAALAGFIQNYVDSSLSPGTVYQYQVYGVNAAGVMSSAGSPIRSISLAPVQIPTPSIVAGAYSTAAGGYQVTVTPAGGTPSGVTWTLEVSESMYLGAGNWGAYGPYQEADTKVSTSLFRSKYTYAGYGQSRDLVRVIGRKAGYTDSNYSAIVGPVNVTWTPP
jgi:hypothetical protein